MTGFWNCSATAMAAKLPSSVSKPSFILLRLVGCASPEQWWYWDEQQVEDIDAMIRGLPWVASANHEYAVIIRREKEDPLSGCRIDITLTVWLCLVPSVPRAAHWQRVRGRPIKLLKSACRC